MGPRFSIVSNSPEETLILGSALAPLLAPGDVIGLTGDLGAGKTVFVQGVAGALGVTDRVTSPTFTLAHEYEGRISLVHIDVYRLGSLQEVFDLGFEELADPGAVMLVEWGEAVAPLLPRRYLEVEIRRSPDVDRDLERIVVWRPHGLEWVRKLEAMRPVAEALLDAASPEETHSDRFLVAGEATARDHRESHGD